MSMQRKSALQFEDFFYDLLYKNTLSPASFLTEENKRCRNARSFMALPLHLNYVEIKNILI